MTSYLRQDSDLTLKPLILFLIVLLMVVFLIPNHSMGQTQQPPLPIMLAQNQPAVGESQAPGSQINNNQYYGVRSYSQAPADLELTAKVKAEIAGNRNLSQSAQNISVTSQNGKVVLQGSVINEYERTTVISLAERAAGSQQVFSQLIILQ